MKALAGLLISISLVLGTVAGTTAYLPKVATIHPADELLLAAPAGVNAEAPGQPLFDPGKGSVVLTADVLDQLREAGVERVRVKDFAIHRWSHRYLFLLACVGLAAGAWLVRRETRLHVAEAAETGGSARPDQLMADALLKVRTLRAEVADLGEAQARRKIVQTLDDLGRSEFDGFVQSRPMLVGRYGMAGYAQVMDRFAAAERQLNRAWSAAADHVMDESLDCLAEGEARLQETVARLKE